MNKDWATVFSSSHLALSSMVMGVLNEHGIPAKILNKQDSAYVMIGEVEVLVPVELLETAKAIVHSQNEKK